jgi:hypothetical protein
LNIVLKISKTRGSGKIFLPLLLINLLFDFSEWTQPLKPEDIADIIAFVVSRPYHVNIADLTVMPTAQASSTIVNKN